MTEQTEQTYDTITIRYTFSNACHTGQLEEAQLLYLSSPDLVLSVFDCVFMNVCHRGHLEVAKWLLQVKPDINISASNEYAFRGACVYGHLEVAQWLYQVGLASTIPPTIPFGIVEAKIVGIDISANEDEAFRWRFRNGSMVAVNQTRYQYFRK